MKKKKKSELFVWVTNEQTNLHKTKTTELVIGFIQGYSTQKSLHIAMC